MSEFQAVIETCPKCVHRNLSSVNSVCPFAATAHMLNAEDVVGKMYDQRIDAPVAATQKGINEQKRDIAALIESIVTASELKKTVMQATVSCAQESIKATEEGRVFTPTETFSIEALNHRILPPGNN